MLRVIWIILRNIIVYLRISAFETWAFWLRCSRLSSFPNIWSSICLDIALYDASTYLEFARKIILLLFHFTQLVLCQEKHFSPGVPNKFDHRWLPSSGGNGDEILGNIFHRHRAFGYDDFSLFTLVKLMYSRSIRIWNIYSRYPIRVSHSSRNRLRTSTLILDASKCVYSLYWQSGRIQSIL